ncbi:cyclin-dependent kinase 5 activator 2b [Pangasianodon hypophthalmus]|uniref:cyclin-dependent kinase 5 activator 2b n=1 Tax=Pangasianodon hypophthalmus TaxID=310915 RepID=UPI0023070085|nr:cyclin-dependent kinase 5 activator 2b [Pangasianodon hypophthalmus]
MGTTLSVSPMLRDEVAEHKRRGLSKPRLIVSAFGFKLVKQKSGKKVNPHPLPFQTIHTREDLKAPSQNCPPQSEEIKTSSQKLEQTKLPVTKQLEDVQKNQPSRQFITSPVRIVLQTSTGELLLCLGRFLRRRCLKISDLTSNEVIAWFRNVDRTLLMQGWQEEGFITSPILVFVYLLCRDSVSEDLTSPGELHGVFLTCLYLTYSYLGTEISYPLQPFIIDDNKEVFWEQALGVIDKLSSDMLRINMDPQFFTEVFQELKSEGEVKNRNSLDR